MISLINDEPLYKSFPKDPSVNTENINNNFLLNISGKEIN